MVYSAILFPQVVCTAVLLSLAVNSGLARMLPSGRLVAVTFFLGAAWTACYGMEIASASLASKILWARIGAVPVSFLPVAWLALTLKTTGRGAWRTPARISLLCVVPVITAVVALADGLDRFYRFGYRLDPLGDSPALLYVAGPFDILRVAYTYCLVAASIALLVVSTRSARLPTRRQAVLVILGLAFPLLADALYALGITVPTGVTMAPVALMGTGILVSVALHRVRSLDIVPIVSDVIFQAIEDVSLIIDAQGRLAGFNAAAAASLGLEWKDSPGRPLEALPPPWGMALAPLAESPSHRGEVTLIREGVPAVYDLAISSIHDPSGHTIGRLIILHDLTERRRAEEQLRVSQERLQLAFESANDGLWDWHLDDGHTYWSPRYHTMLGYPPGEPAPSFDSWKSIVHPDDLAAAVERIETCLREGWETCDLEVRMRTRDGGWRWILSRGRVVERTPAGVALRMVGTHVDVTERRETEAKLRGFIDQATEAIMLVDEQGALIEFNPSAERMTGIPRDEAIGRTVWSMMERTVPRNRWTPGYRERLAARFREALRTGSADFIQRPLRGTLLRADGTARSFEQFNFVIRTNRGFQIGVITHDTTAARETEEALRRSEEQLRQAQKMEAIGRLAGGVAHDFNNILTVIGGYSRMIQEVQPPGSPVLGNIAEITRAADRAATLTRQLLAFSRKQVLQPRVIDPAALLGNLQTMLARVIGEDVELSIHAAAETGAIRADPGQVEQVLLNLVVNARDAMPEGGKLILETANRILDDAFVSTHPMVKAGTYVAITVQDTGHGMDRETMSRIFEPFFTTKPQGKGTGLGLSMAYGVVKQSDGHIFCESEPGKGTTFTLYFPFVREKAEPLPARGPDGGPAAGFETILLVEDEQAVRTYARAVLQKRGYRVVEAVDGQEALAACADGALRVDLLLTDVVMPRMSGRELARMLREKCPGARVLYMSGYAESAVSADDDLDAAARFIKKPFSPRELLGLVREMLDAR